MMKKRAKNVLHEYFTVVENVERDNGSEIINQERLLLSVSETTTTTIHPSDRERDQI
jgi:hypothetical protein